jgi:hypothetical protein
MDVEIWPFAWGRWGPGYRSVWVEIYVVNVKGYSLGGASPKTGGGSRAGNAEGRDWLVSMGKEGPGIRFMAILLREGLYSAVSKGE